MNIEVPVNEQVSMAETLGNLSKSTVKTMIPMEILKSVLNGLAYTCPMIVVASTMINVSGY
jgi:hypothetical protein